MASERIKLFEADIDTDGIIKKSVELREQMVTLRQDQKLLKLTVGETNEEFIKNEARLKAVSKEYRLNQQQVSNLSTSTDQFAGVTEKLVGALDKEVLSIANAKDNNKELRTVRDQLNATTEEGAAAIDEINKKIDENTAFIKENVSELEVQKINIGDYKNQIIEAYNELNIFNGGIGGFIGRAQEAGGVTNLLTKTTKSLATGIYGMTKASLAFIATPIGAVLAAIGLILGAVIKYLSSTQEGIDAVTSVTRPLMAVFESLIGVLQEVGKYLFEAFSNPKKTINEIYQFVKDNVITTFQNLYDVMVGIATLDFEQAKKGFEGLNDQAKQSIGALVDAGKNVNKFFNDAIEKGKELDRLEKELAQVRIQNITSVRDLNEQLKRQNQLAEDQTKPISEREAAAKRSIEVAKEINALKQTELDLEIAILQNKQDRNDTSNAEKEELAELLAQKSDANAQALEIETTQTNKLNGIRKEANSDAISLAKIAFDEAIKLQNLELSLFIESQGTKAKTLQEGLDIAKQVAEKRLKILEAELKAGKKTREEYNLEVLKIQNDLLQKQAELTTDLAQRELEAYIQKNQSKIDSDLFFSDESLRIEQERLNSIAEQQREFARIQFEQGVINQQDYNAAINEANENNRLALEEADKTREEAKKEAKIIDLENQILIAEEQFENKFQLESERLERQRLQEVEKAEKTGADITLINAKYAQQQKKIEEALQNQKLAVIGETYGQVATLLGENTIAAKAAGLAQATINTYQGVTQVLATESVLPEPLATVARAVSIATVVGTGLASAAKIAGVKMPKAEHGIALDIGGKRHSSGGTKFYGEDGTNFEAEKGEKMFILNRQASAALGPLLSDINQQHGGVSLSRSSSYLAAGGQVIRGAQSGSSIDFKQMQDVIRESVMEGAAAGTRVGSREGSASGTYSGMVDREDNLIIAAGANF